MAGLSSLEIAKRGLQAQQYALDVVSNNIANINTEGYSRRSAIMVESSPIVGAGLSYGTGVLVDSVQTYRQEFFDKEIRSNISSLSGYDTDVEIYQRIESILAEPTENGLSESITKFFSAFYDLSLSPEDVATRTYVAEVTSTMSDQFQTIGTKISELKNEIGNKIQSQLMLANGLISQIAGLNEAIASVNGQAGQDVQTYHDQRELKLEQLSAITDVSVAIQSDGQANIYASGICVVSDGDFSELQVKSDIDSNNGSMTLRLSSYNKDTDKSITVVPNSGIVATYMKHYNKTLNSTEESDVSIISKIDKLADAIVTNVNKIAIEGYGLDDKTAPNRTIFMEYNNQPNLASNIAINPELLDDARKIPIATGPGLEGSNDIAVQIARLANDSTLINGYTSIEYYSGFVGQLATYSQYAENNQSRLQLISDQLGNQRESIIGVNDDEEALGLVKFQRVYESCSRIVTTLNEMLMVLVNLGK